MIVKNKIIGHRGASMFAPENSASSLEVAFSMGLKWIETDVQITLDNKLVIFKDDANIFLGNNKIYESINLF